MVELWTVVLAVVLGVLTMYHYAFRNLDYFRKRGVPYVPPVPLFGNMAANVFRKKTFTETVSDAYNYNRDAKYVGFFSFSDPVVFLKDLELIKSIMIKNFDNFPDHKMMAEEIPDKLFRDNLFGLQGQRWKDTRVLLSPTFTSSKMKTLFKLMKECTANLIDHLKAQSVKSTVFDMKDVLTKYTNDVIVTSAFGISVNSHEDPENDFLLMGKEATNFSGARSLRLLMVRTFPLLSKILNVKLFDDRISDFYKNVVTTTIAARKAKGIVRPDMLQLMMQARDNSEKIKLTDDDMTAHAFIFYFGGFDTASLLMYLAVHEIAVNSNVHEKLQAEVDQVLEQCNGDVTYEALHAMRYLDSIMNETLRLYSPATIGDRLCRQPFELPPAQPGLKPFVVEPGVSVWIPFSAILKDEKYFSNPDKFCPERFMDDDNQETFDPAAFTPFGNGPRICIGNRFALMEAKLAIFQLMANFKLLPCSKTVNPLKPNPSSFVLSMEGGVWLELQPRHR